MTTHSSLLQSRLSWGKHIFPSDLLVINFPTDTTDSVSQSLSNLQNYISPRYDQLKQCNQRVGFLARRTLQLSSQYCCTKQKPGPLWLQGGPTSEAKNLGGNVGMEGGRAEESLSEVIFEEKKENTAALQIIINAWNRTKNIIFPS